VSAIDLGAFIVLALALRGSQGHVAVSMAVAGSSAVQMVLLFVGLKWRLGTLRANEIGASVARVTASSAVAAVAGWAAARAAAGGADGAIGRALPGLAGALSFSLVYLAAAWGTGARELAELAAPIRRRLAPRAAR
jgi:peptidoglycan biosynthesis protein MviN/MurJ (putative lipid II flippase)